MKRTDTRTALTTARADLAELAARVSPLDPRADRLEVRELYRLRRLVIDLEKLDRRERLALTR